MSYLPHWCYYSGYAERHSNIPYVSHYRWWRSKPKQIWVTNDLDAEYSVYNRPDIAYLKPFRADKKNDPSYQYMARFDWHPGDWLQVLKVPLNWPGWNTCYMIHYKATPRTSKSHPIPLSRIVKEGIKEVAYYDEIGNKLVH